MKGGRKGSVFTTIKITVYKEDMFIKHYTTKPSEYIFRAKTSNTRKLGKHKGDHYFSPERLKDKNNKMAEHMTG